MVTRPSDSASASTTVTTPSTVARVRTAGQSNAFNSGCGSANPEVSITMASSGRSRDSNLSMVGTKSSATVQQMQPLVSSTMSPGAQAFAAHSSTSPPSNPASPNSLTITAMRRPSACVSSERNSVVLPAPKNPVSTVTGTRDISIFSSRRALQPERKPGCDEHNIGNGGGDDLVQAALCVAKAAAERRLWHQAETDFVGHEHDWVFRDAEKSGEPAGFRFRIAACEHQVRQPKRQAIDQHGAPMGRLPRQCIDQRHRLLDGDPAVAAPSPVMADAGPHLV